MMVQLGEFGLIHVPHRGNVVADVVVGALAISRGFADIGGVVAQMHGRVLDERERWDLAARALAVRYQRRSAGAPQRRLPPLAVAHLPGDPGERDARRHRRPRADQPQHPDARDPRDPRGRAHQPRALAARHVAVRS